MVVNECNNLLCVCVTGVEGGTYARTDGREPTRTSERRQV